MSQSQQRSPARIERRRDTLRSSQLRLGHSSWRRGQPTTSAAVPSGLGFSQFDLMRIFGQPTCSPTALGERVLRYHRLAATGEGEPG
jgi:hypothetical protein